MIVAQDAILTLCARDSDQYMANGQRKPDTLLRSSRPQDGGLISYIKLCGISVFILKLLEIKFGLPLEGLLHVLFFLSGKIPF